jgi:hypothetical protein
MKNALGLLSGLLISTSAGCCDAPGNTGESAAPPGEAGPGPAARPIPWSRETARGHLMLLPAVVTTPEAITWTSRGELAVINGKTGSISQLASTANVSGQPDLIYNPWTSEAMVFELDEDTQAGELSSYPVHLGPSGAVLGSRVHRWWIDGEVRLLAAPLGYVIFEASYGDRWKVLFQDQQTALNVLAPSPPSAWVTRSSGDGFTIHAMSYSLVGPIFRHTVSVGLHTVSGLETSSLGIDPASDPPTARMMPAPALGDAVLFDVAGSDLAVRLVKGPHAAPVFTVPLGKAGLRVEHALAFDGGEVALLLLSGESRVMALEISAEGEIKSAATLLLPGVVREEKRFFSHDLEALGPHRALAATSVGVFAIRMTRSGAGLSLALDPAFAGGELRGPIAALAPHSPW